MTADEKNALIQAAKTGMNTAIALVSVEVYSGMVQAPALLLAAGGLIRATGKDQEAAQADQRAAECAGILAIPWPFIYIASGAWISAVAQLRDSLPQFIDLEPVARRAEGALREREARAADARSRWDALTESQRAVLAQSGITADMLRSLGSA